jgi:hypothetical protein
VGVTGIVRTPEGEPVEGVLVMGVDLNYAETDSTGRFTLARPEMALIFWCTGFLPQARPLTAGESSIEVVLSPVAAMRASA